MPLPTFVTILRVFQRIDDPHPPLFKAAVDLLSLWRYRFSASAEPPTPGQVQPTDYEAVLVWCVDREACDVIADSCPEPGRDAPLADRTYGDLVASLAKLYATLEVLGREQPGVRHDTTQSELIACGQQLDKLTLDAQQGRVRLPPPDLDRPR
ncbi:MAG: hypothetical protein J2P17_01010 [Mycobacterium sp.]|nr:hypothetical protein [Mycobacterium sp.]